MKKFLLVPALAAFFAVQSASAISLIQFTPNSSGPANPDVTFSGYPDGPQAGLVIPGGILSYSNAVIVQGDVSPSPGVQNNGDGAMPFPTVNGDYLSVKTNGVATFSYAVTQGRFAFMWGSIDHYNTISFSLGNVGVGSFTGHTVVNPPVNDNGVQGFNGSAYVAFAGAFDKVVLTSSQNSFEIDNVSVPDGGMTLALLGLSLLGLPFLRRFKK